MTFAFIESETNNISIMLLGFIYFIGDVMKYPFTLTCIAALLSGLSSAAIAADVPAGTVLAKQQDLVRHIKDEPASLKSR